MIELSRFCENLFASPRISMAELRKFTEDHLARLKAQNADGSHAGQFGGLLAATGPLFGAFERTLSIKDSVQAEREGKTITKNEALRAFQRLVRKIEPRVADRLGRPGAEYEKFFPHGLKEFNQATMATALTLMDRMVKLAGDYSAQIGTQPLADFTAARTAFAQARSVQMVQKGEVTEAIHERDAARAALETQLMANVLAIASLLIGHAERMREFFDQSLLRNRRKPRAKK